MLYIVIVKNYVSLSQYLEVYQCPSACIQHERTQDAYLCNRRNTWNTGPNPNDILPCQTRLVT